MSSKNKKYYRENFFTGHPMDDEEYAKYNHTKRLVLRILRWAERAKTDKSGPAAHAAADRSTMAAIASKTQQTVLL